MTTDLCKSTLVKESSKVEVGVKLLYFSTSNGKERVPLN